MAPTLTSRAGLQLPSSVNASATGGAVPWTAATLLTQNVIYSNAGSLYLCNTTHTSASTFGADVSNFTALVPNSVGNAIPFSYSGALSAVVGAGHFPVPVNGTIAQVRASVGTAPTGASVIVDVKKNDSTVFTTTANRPTIAAGATDSGAAVPDTTSVTAGDRLSVDIAQTGTTVAGSDLTVVVFIRPS